MNILKFRYLLLFFTVILIGCSDNSTDEDQEEAVYFVSADKTASYSVQTLQLYAALSGESQLTDMIKYGVKRYLFTYKTKFRNETIEASGVLFLPDGATEAAPLISVQHGTEFEKSEAPSANEEPTGMEYFASSGYVAFMPDFIGYGKSDDIFHPYYDKKSSANAVIDMVKAVKEYLTREKIAFNDKLFLAGYSEGGYVTLAAAEELEKNATHNLKVTAVAAGAGGYDLEQMLQSITENETYSYPAYLAFVLMAYNSTYGWDKPASYFFQGDYATAVSTYVTGYYSGSYINEHLTSDVTALLNPDFYSALNEADGELELKAKFKSNSVMGWKNSAPIRLYHGTSDEIIPFNNSEITLDSFDDAGSTAVTLTSIPSGTHSSSFMPMLRDVVPWFDTMR